MGFDLEYAIESHFVVNIYMFLYIYSEQLQRLLDRVFKLCTYSSIYVTLLHYFQFSRTIRVVSTYFLNIQSHFTTKLDANLLLSHQNIFKPHIFLKLFYSIEQKTI